MGFREDLLARLATYSPAVGTEVGAKEAVLDFIAGNEVLGRGNPVGHITGSALVVNSTRTRMLLNHHAKLDKWVQFGGHIEDADETVAATAMREAREESGLRRLTFASNGVFDVDVHLVPERAGQPAHRHFDIRFLLEADEAESPVASEESKSVRWVELGDISSYSTSESMLRMARKVPRVSKPGERLGGGLLPHLKGKKKS